MLQSASVTTNNRLPTLYTWGWPDDGRLAHSGPPHDPTKESNVPIEVWPYPNFVLSNEERDVVTGLAGGGRHSVLCTSDGRVLAAGWNGHGQIGIRHNEEPGRRTKAHGVYEPVEVQGLKSGGRRLFCNKVAAGYATSYAVTGEGKVYSWGKGTFGALGQDFEEDEDPEEDQFKARIVKELSQQTVTHISAGHQHCVAQTFGNRTYAWGRNNFGQLGLGKEAMEAGWIGKPTEVKWRQNSEIVKRISAGHNHTVCLIEITRPDQRVEITVFAWGCVDDSRLGGVDPRMHHVPQEVHNITTVVRKNHWVLKDICAGGAHTLALEKYNGLVLAWGQGRYGQLGYGHVWDRADPVMITGLRSVIDLKCGSRHSLALVDRVTTSDATDGELYAWGFNDYGELGLGDCDVRLQPHKVTGLINADVLAIGAGYKHSMACTKGIAKKVRDLPEYQEFLDLLHSEGMLVYDALKRAMEDKGLNPDYLDTPDALLPGQPGMEEKPCEYDGAEPGMQYCIDTLKNADENEVIMKLRGTYETTYHCIRCRFQHVCMACARHCHGRHAVRVNFKLRHYDDTCQCCEHDICNVRWSVIRHEFDKLALKEEDRCVSMEQLQDVLEGLRDDIEERRGGLPLTSKQKEDDLKAAIDAMHEMHRLQLEAGIAKDGKQMSVKEQAEREAAREEKERVKAIKQKERAARRREAEDKGIDFEEESDDDDDEHIRVDFKSFEKWYVSYLEQDAVDDEDGEGGEAKPAKKHAQQGGMVRRMSAADILNIGG